MTKIYSLIVPFCHVSIEFYQGPKRVDELLLIAPDLTPSHLVDLIPSFAGIDITIEVNENDISYLATNATQDELPDLSGKLEIVGAKKKDIWRVEEIIAEKLADLRLISEQDEAVVVRQDDEAGVRILIDHYDRLLTFPDVLDFKGSKDKRYIQEMATVRGKHYRKKLEEILAAKK